MEIKITPFRSITNAEADKIAGLAAQLGYPSSRVETLNRIEHILDSENHCIFGAYRDQIIVGWIHVFYCLRVETAPIVEIAALVVDRNYRKQQIGKKLIEAATEWAKKYQPTKIYVRCNEIRTETHKFYAKLNFKVSKKQLVFEKEI